MPDSSNFDFSEKWLREAAQIEEESGCDIAAGVPLEVRSADFQPSQEAPKVGSRWFNNRRKKVYTVFGVVSHCEEEAVNSWEVLYCSDDMPRGQYKRRSVESWHGTNRDGLPRFVPQPSQVTPQLETQSPGSRPKYPHRPQLNPGDLENAIAEITVMVGIRAAQKGLASYGSCHEILGILREEFKEYLDAVHAKESPERKIDELIDIAVGCIFAISSIRTGSVDW